MRNLLILRHAKADAGDSSLPDHERPLNEQGKRAAVLIGQFMKHVSLHPDLVLSSTAVRASQTCQLLLASAGFNVEIRYDPALYEADEKQLIEIISGVADEREWILLVGHNPSLENLLSRLVGQKLGMSSGSLAHLVLPIEQWHRLDAVNNAHLQRLISPKEVEHQIS